MSGELEFGIGIHNGFMVAQKADATLKYTSIGNTVAFANKLAEEAENTVLMSDAARKHIMRDVVATKVGEAHNHNFYEVTGTKDKARDQAKLKDLLSRMDNT